MMTIGRVAWILLLAAGTAEADVFHYNNTLIGDRAMGLGGAYTAISDDASGVHYNPAGLGFALSNDISGSANAFYSKKTTYKKTIGDDNFTEKSGGSMAPFFGGLQKLDNLAPGLVAAFGIATLDSDLKDQNDEITDQEFQSKGEGGAVTTAYLERLHRTVQQRASTTAFSGALAYRVSGSFAVGLGVSYISIEELVQEYQNTQTGTPGQIVLSQIVQNIRQLLSAAAIQPSLGFQWAFANSWSLGFNYKHPISVTQTFRTDTDSSNYAFAWRCDYQDGDTTRSASVGKNCDQAVAAGEVPAGAARASRQIPLSISNGSIQSDGSGAPLSPAIPIVAGTAKSKNPIGDFPGEARLGLAWFASPRLLLSFDVQHVMEAKSGDMALYEREAVTNFALGSEYYLTPSLPLRFGLFTNNDSRPEVSDNKTGQSDHIDFLGTSLFLAWAQPNSQVAFGAVVQQGEGKAQKIGGYNVQDVEAFSGTLAFSATHNF